MNSLLVSRFSTMPRHLRVLHGLTPGADGEGRTSVPADMSASALCARPSAVGHGVVRMLLHYGHGNGGGDDASPMAAKYMEIKIFEHHKSTDLVAFLLLSLIRNVLTPNHIMFDRVYAFGLAVW